MPPARTPGSDHLRRLATMTLGDPPLPAEPGERASFARSLTDEFGARPRCVPPLLARLTGAALPPPPEPRSLDERLWWLAVAGEAEQARTLTEGSGPLSREDDEASIEVRTECELSALHALSALAILTRDPALWRRAESAGRWLIAELQPDNATGRPWGVHLFIDIAGSATDPETASAAALYAETLLHNCIVSQGRPDRISACILLDAAEILDAIGRTSAHP